MSTQKERVNEFVSITGVSTKQAETFLRRSAWSLNAALDDFYSSGASQARQGHVSSGVSSAIQTFFQNYADSGGDQIGYDGLARLCNDIGVEPVDPATLVLAHRCGAKQMGILTRSEFARGMAAFGGSSSAEQLKTQVAEMRRVLEDKKGLKEVYAFTFNFARDSEAQRTLPVEECIEYWKLLLKGHFALLDEWIDFCQRRCKNNISRDTWMMLYDLATSIDPTLSDYDEDGAWPVLIDEFVDEHRKRTAAQG